MGARGATDAGKGRLTGPGGGIVLLGAADDSFELDADLDVLELDDAADDNVDRFVAYGMGPPSILRELDEDGLAPAMSEKAFTVVTVFAFSCSRGAGADGLLDGAAVAMLGAGTVVAGAGSQSWMSMTEDKRVRSVPKWRCAI